MENLLLAEETDGYQTVTDPSNTDKRLLIAGSQNVLVTQQKKVQSRPGYMRLGPSNAALTPIKNAWTWNTSTGSKLPQRFYNGILEVYLTTVDGLAINAWTQVSSIFATAAMLRPALTEIRSGAGWYDSTEAIDLQLMVQGDDNIFEWGGGIAVVASVNSGSGTLGTFDQPNTVGTAFRSSGGVDYVVGDVLTVTGGTAQITVDTILPGGVKTTQIHTAGSGYAANDVLKLATPSGGQPAYVKVLTVDGSGVVLTYSILTAGSGYVGDVTQTITTTGGGGSNFSVNVTNTGNTINAWHLSANGTGYSVATLIGLTGGSGSGASLNILSVGAYSITKAGTTTFAQNRFYHTRNKTLVCVRTGQVFNYSSAGDSVTVTGLSADPSGLVAGDILIQQVVTQTQKPTQGRNNDIPFIFQNQLILGSNTDAQVYLSKNSSYYDYTYSSPRLSGEGGLLTLDGSTKAINALGSYLLCFSGRNAIFRADYQQLSVSQSSGTGITAETLNVQKFDLGVNQGALNHECVIPIDSSQLAYLTNEVSLRVINATQTATGLTVVFGSLDSKTLSNPIKPDFDAETWTGAFGIWYKTTLMFSAPAASHTYMLNFIEDANGKSLRFWNPPQILPVGAMTAIDLDDGNGPILCGHSNVVPETYKLFVGLSDGQYDNMDVADKIAIHAIAKYAYDNMKKRDLLKTFDEYAVDGEINPNTKDLQLSLLYDFDGHTQIVQKIVDGTDEAILEGNVTNNALAQSMLAAQPLGGLLTPPDDARRFRVIFEIAREDFYELSATFETNNVDRYWAILAHGSNASLSPRKGTTIRK